MLSPKKEIEDVRMKILGMTEANTDLHSYVIGDMNIGDCNNDIAIQVDNSLHMQL